MRKTRVLAALLCLMMIVTAIPMMQATAAETATTKTEADLLDCFKVVAKQDYDSGFSWGSQSRLDEANLSLETTTDGASVLKMVGHTVADWTSGAAAGATRDAQFNKSEAAVAYAVPDGMMRIRFQLEGAGKFHTELRNVNQIGMDLANGKTIKKGDGPSVTMADSGWHEVVVITGGTADAPTGDFWYRSGNGDFQYFGNSSIKTTTNKTYISISVEQGTTLYLDSVVTYEKDYLASVLDGAEETHTIDFTDYYTNSSYTASKGHYAPTGKTAVVMTQQAGSDMYRLYEAEGGWSIQYRQVSSIGTNNGPRTRDLNDSVYSTEYGYALGESSKTPDGSASTRLLASEITSEGLAVRSGSNSSGNTDSTGLKTLTAENNGWKWDNTAAGGTNSIKPTGTGDSEVQYTYDYAFADGGVALNMGYSGAVMVTVKLDKDGSTASVLLQDGENGSGRDVGFKVSNTGISLLNVAGIAYGATGINEAESATSLANSDPAKGNFTLTTGTWYDIVLKNDYNRYTVYARQSGTGAFIKVVSGSTMGLSAANTNKKLVLQSGYTELDDIPTKIVKFTHTTLTAGTSNSDNYKNGLLRQFKAADVAEWEVNDTPLTDKNYTVSEIGDEIAVRPVSSVTFGGLTTYTDSANSGLTREEVLGANAVILNQAKFDAEAVTLIGEGKAKMLTDGYTPTGTATANGMELNVNGEKLQLGWKKDGYFLPDNTALEVSYSLPADSAAESKLLIQCSVSDTQRVFLDLLSTGQINNNNGDFRLENYRGISGQQSLLLVRSGDYAKYYKKMPNGNYAFVGMATPGTGSWSDGPIKIMSNNSADTSGNNVWTIHSVTRYDLNAGVGNTTTLPGSGLRQYVNEDFADLNESSYSTTATSSVEGNAGSVTSDGTQLVIVNPTHGGSGSSGNSAFHANDAGIPAGGYADMQIKMQAHMNFIIRDGKTSMEIHLGSYTNEANNGSFYYENGTKTAITSGVNFIPNQWYDVRIVRDADGKYSAYAKQTGETVWNKLFEDATAATNNDTAVFQIRSGQFMSPVTSNNENFRQCVKSLNIYGPASGIMTVLDGTQTTKVMQDGDKLQNTVKVSLSASNRERQLIFAGYEGDVLVDTEMVTVPANQETVVVPTGMDSDDIFNIKIFLWDKETLAPCGDSVTLWSADRTVQVLFNNVSYDLNDIEVPPLEVDGVNYLSTEMLCDLTGYSANITGDTAVLTGDSNTVSITANNKNANLNGTTVELSKTPISMYGEVFLAARDVDLLLPLAEDLTPYENGVALHNLYYDEDDNFFNLVTTIIGDAGTSRGFAWQAKPEYENMVIEYAEGTSLTNAVEVEQKEATALTEPVVYNYSVTDPEVPVSYYENMLFYKVGLEGLNPGTIYCYRIGDTVKNEWSEEYTFKTEGTSVNEFSVIAVADSQASSATGFDYYNRTMVKALEECPEPAFVMHLGDITDNSMRDDWWNMYFEASKSFCTSVPTVSVVGNHETRATGLKYYNLRFMNPQNGLDLAEDAVYDSTQVNKYDLAVLEELDNTVYSFDYGNVHFAVLNTGTDWMKTSYVMDLQKEWLKKDIEENGKTWNVVLLHIGVYPARDRGQVTAAHLYELMDECNVDLVLQGHDHITMRTKPMYNNAVAETGGTVYSILGCAGTKRYGFADKEGTDDDNGDNKTDSVAILSGDWVEVATETDRYNPTYNILTFSEDSITVKSKALDGTELDSYVLTK